MALRDDYDQVFRSLSRVDLQVGAQCGDKLDFPDLFGDGDRGLWLGFYTDDGLRNALGRYGLWDDFAEVGYRRVRLETRCDDPDEHMLRVWSEDPPITDAPLLELVARRSFLIPREDLATRFDGDSIGAGVLDVEWLQLQRPDVDFTKDRPPLPGQQHPGLGLGRQILELLRLASKRIGLEGLVTVPSYFHNAYLYVSEFSYVDPREQGLFLALCRDVLPQAFGSVSAASWALTLGMVVAEDQPDQPFDWFHDVMLAPISERLHRYVRSDQYRREVAQGLSSRSFRVFEKALARELQAHGIRPLDNERVREWIAARV